MAKSKTKYIATENEIKKLFADNGLGSAAKIEILGNGEFNAAYYIKTDNGSEYVLKIAPPADATVMTYEKGMMKAEVFWYENMQKYTDIIVPKVFFSDFECKTIMSNCFVMEMMKGEPLWACQFTEEESKRVQEKKINMLTQIHKIKNDKFGYVQSGLYDSWYEAIKNMAGNLVKDCKELGKETPDGEKLIAYIDKYENLLRNVPCRMVNFDLWDSNVLYRDGELVWIDPERSFWGDPVADFITLGAGQKTPLSGKTKEIEIYNKTAKEPIVLTEDTERRYAIAVAYLALIEEVEKYVRYEPDEENYIRNTVDAGDMYDMAFKIFEE